MKYSKDHHININRPEAITSEIDVVGFDGGTKIAYAVEALMEGYYVLVLDVFSSGLKILSELKRALNPKGESHSYQEQRKSRAEFQEISNRLLLEVDQHRLSIKKAPRIGWLKILYPELETFLIAFPQIQGLNSAWQWYQKGSYIHVLHKNIYPWYGTYFPSRFEHLELFDDYLKQYVGEKNTAVDVGVGSGILSMQLLQNGFKNIIATDSNPNAIIGMSHYLAKKTEKNIELYYGDLFADYKGQADLIVFNPPWIPLKRDVKGIDKAMYYDEELFPRFFEQAKEYLTEKGKLIMIFSNLAEISKLTDNHPIKEELENGNRFKKERLFTKNVSMSSKKTKRNLDRRAKEIVELWVLNKA